MIDDLHDERPIGRSTEDRSKALFYQHQQQVFRRTDRMFAVLMGLQWLGAIAAAYWISPLTWEGTASRVHSHVWLAIIFGGALASLPMFLAWRYPGKTATRHVIAAAQVLFSALLIHVMGGRIETHFHVFGSLAFLAMYRDWRVLIPATAIVAIDHFVRGMFWPQSVFGVLVASPWRPLEHAAWVIFEDVFLILSCRAGTLEMWNVAKKTAELERTNQTIERIIAERTTQLEVAVRIAEGANRAKSEFLANMSHEIRTPLNGILGFADLLAKGFVQSETDRQEYLHHIQTSGRHLLTLINDILDLSKIEAGQLTLERVTCSPHEIISEVFSVLRVEAQTKGLSLTCNWSGAVPKTIVTDPVRLRQLLMNVAGNAIKFTGEGSIRVDAKLDQSGQEPLLLIKVVDTGIGIPPDKLENIFDPFVQSDSSVTRRFGGTGLGLTISRRIVTALGGDITVDSELGVGTTFTFTAATGSLSGIEMLAAPPTDALTGKSVVPSADKWTMPSAKVLLVEDGAINRKLIVAVLSKAGIDMTTAEDGQLGVERALQEDFDLILMDMQMPIMDGYAATSRLRQEGLTIPIIALTAHAMKGDEAKCKAAGCTGYLAKPIDMDGLLETVAEAVTQHGNGRAGTLVQECLT